MTGRVDIYWIFQANFTWLLSSKISQLETLKLLEVLVFFLIFGYWNFFGSSFGINLQFKNSKSGESKALDKNNHLPKSRLFANNKYGQSPGFNVIKYLITFQNFNCHKA